MQSIMDDLVRYDEEGRAAFLASRTIMYSFTVAVLVAIWTLFDYLMDQKNFELFLYMRTLFVASVFVAIFIYYKSGKSVRYYRVLGLFVYLMVIAMILPMIFITDEKFAYFLGFSTVFFGTAIVMIWPLKYLFYPMFISVGILLAGLWSEWPPSKEFTVAAFLIVNVASISILASWLTYHTHIRSDELLTRLSTLSVMDKLTGLYNRRFFDEGIEKEIASSARRGKPLSMMIIDIDHFKKYNDNYGHHMGDQCLKIISSSLKKSISRKTDFIARYGGEEFAIILPDTDRTAALNLAERVMREIRLQRLPHASSETDRIVTVSIGIGTLIADRFTEAKTLIVLADEALYRAKEKGRNRIESNIVE